MYISIDRDHQDGGEASFLPHHRATQAKASGSREAVGKLSRGEKSIALGPMVLDVEPVAVGSARNVMPRLIRDSASGRAFLIRNAKGPTAARALPRTRLQSFP